MTASMSLGLAEFINKSEEEVLMKEACFGVAAFILANVLVGGLRIVFGPTRADRMLVSQFFGTSAVAVLLLLSEATSRPDLRDLAMVFVALAAVTTFAFVHSYAKASDDETMTNEE